LWSLNHLSGSTGIDREGSRDLVSRYVLFQNYPNPFNPETRIKFSLPATSSVTLTVYNVLGQEIKSLVNEIKPAGEYEVTWDGTNRRGKLVPSGVYLYKLEGKNIVETKKMILLK
ncbi:MAG: T9SS type A sorting domain-containing protein, partial [Phycisphaerae bacterium]|nr:T9SS type A sorting domain-containing protein [candidate division KSB1 bacterium]NIV00348.1 T9SS type A sorting domain-containing protein [Phycisphaerae bacterium]NIV70273.1 T9SS type A sorting domain-containing protein [Phycisphaerae bacterium]NIW68453.1 T9SS type A sorting domain-containing protein [candidate division KSB1 bacterium]